MKIKKEKLLVDSEILSHVFLESLSGNIKKAEDIMDEWRDKDGELPEEYEMNLLVNGTELNVERFFNLLWEQYERIVKEHATEIVREQFSYKMSTFQSKLCQMEDVVTHWENEITWNVENPFKNNV